MRNTFLVFLFALASHAQQTGIGVYNSNIVAHVSFLNKGALDGQGSGGILRDSTMLLYAPMNYTVSNLAGGVNFKSTIPDLSANTVLAWPLGTPGGSAGTWAGTAYTAFTGNTGDTTPYVAGKLSPTSFNYSHSGRDVTETTTNISIAAGSSVTVSAWVNPNSFPSSASVARIVEQYYNSSFYLGFSVPSNSQYTFMIHGVACNGGTPNSGLSGWQMVTGTYDGTNIKLYVNSSLVNTCASATAITLTNQPISIGGCGATGSAFAQVGCSAAGAGASNYTGWWDGLIAGVRVYSRALSQPEIAAIYTAENH